MRSRGTSRPPRRSCRWLAPPRRPPRSRKPAFLGVASAPPSVAPRYPRRYRLNFPGIVARGAQPVMPALRSRTVTHGRNMVGARALLRATGVTSAQIGQPIIAVANSFTEFVPGHVHLREVAIVVAD